MLGKKLSWAFVFFLSFFVDLETTVSALAKCAIARLKDPCTTYLIESAGTSSDKQCSVVHGKDLDSVDAKSLPCSHFSLRKGLKVPTAQEVISNFL